MTGYCSSAASPGFHDKLSRCERVLLWPGPERRLGLRTGHASDHHIGETVMDMKKTATVLSVAALAAASAALPAAAADVSKPTGVQLAACNPCAAKRGCAPCGAKKAGCSPCAAKNPCAAKSNPCAAKRGCSPCAAKKKM